MDIKDGNYILGYSPTEQNDGIPIFRVKIVNHELAEPTPLLFKMSAKFIITSGECLLKVNDTFTPIRNDINCNGKYWLVQEN